MRGARDQEGTGTTRRSCDPRDLSQYRTSHRSVGGQYRTGHRSIAGAYPKGIISRNSQNTLYQNGHHSLRQYRTPPGSLVEHTLCQYRTSPSAQKGRPIRYVSPGHRIACS
eukprot:2658442-Rhodomonas_salina.1